VRAAALLAFVALTSATSIASAHSLEFGVLRVIEVPGGARVLLRAGGSEGAPPAIDVELGGSCTFRSPPSREHVDGLLVLRGDASCPRGLAFARIRVSGLSRSSMSVLVRVERADGSVSDTLLDATSPSLQLSAPPSSLDVLVRYGRAGLEHIALGLDHLLFVLALVLVVFDPRARRDGRRAPLLLLSTVTGFTLGHSLTLGLAAVGAISLPSAPVEVCIALSIVLLAAELARRPDDGGDRDAWTFARPWLVASAFGLLHGLGFAGALSALGLPQRSLGLALLGFNVGVELGQLAFVAAVLPVVALARRLPARLAARPIAAYAIGVVATVWTMQRLDGLF
jgi:hypothetical protein